MSEPLLATPTSRWPVGRDLWPAGQDGHEEDCRWIGKPWRRLELLINRHFWQGELVERNWTASVTLGLRRLGWTLQFSLTRDQVQDWSEERQ